MQLKYCASIVFAVSIYGQTPQAPQGLTVVSATAQKVQLSWTAADNVATGYTVQRKALTGSYSTVLTVSGTTATDNTIDPYTTYVYRVRATTSSSSSGASNEVTVGPPPFGYNTAVPYPAGLDPYYAGYFGAEIRTTLDTNGDPAIAYTFDDPNQDGDYSDSALFFVRWDRAHYQWTAPVQVALIGEVQEFTLTPISIAQDASNGVFGIAYEDETNPDTPTVSVALSSDGGLTWSIKSLTGDGEGYSRPTVALGSGNVYLSFYHDFDGTRFVNGAQSDDPANWNSTLVPIPAPYQYYTRFATLALDSNGNPAVAYIVDGENGEGEAFWRPGGQPVVITDNGGVQNDYPDIRLSFFGTTPRVVFDGYLFDYYDDYDHDLWMLASPDDGTTWSSPVNIHSDGNRDLTGPIDMATGSQGQVAIVTQNNSGNLGNVACDSPKLAMSPDMVSWTTCGLSPIDSTSYSGLNPNVRFLGNDTLYVTFRSDADGGDSPLGVILWRQPPDWVFPQLPPPQESRAPRVSRGANRGN